MYGTLSTITLANGSTVQGIKVAIPNPPKEAVLKLPTSAEYRDLLIVLGKLDKGRSKSDLERKLPYLELFKKLRLDDGEDFDEYESEYIVSYLTETRIADYEK